MRVLPFGIGLLLLLATAAWAEDEAPARRVVIVLDRGAAAEESHRTDANNALRIWASLAARGIDCRLLAAGVDGDDSTLVDDVPPTKPGLTALDRRPVFAFRGPTDPAAVLEHVLAGEGDGPLDVILLGPFHPAEDDGKADAVVKRWNTRAPAGSRILSVRNHASARTRLEGARGLATTGRLVVGFADPEVETQPFSPFRPEREGIRATIRVLVDSLRLDAPTGGEQDTRPFLRADSDVPADQITRTALEGLHTFTLVRRPQDGRLATLSFFRDAARDDVRWLVDPPRPLSFAWETLAQEAVLVDAEGKPAPPFSAVDVTVAKPRRVTLRLLRTRTGPAPAWRVRAAEGELPEGLAVRVGDEVKTSAEVGESPVVITYTAQAGQPVEAGGTLVLEAEGLDAPVRLPYEIRVGRGKVTLEADAQPAALPASADEPRTTLRLVAGNDNAPAAVRLRATTDGGQERWLRGLLGASPGSVTRWDLQEDLILDVGTEHTLAFELSEDAPPEIIWPCTVTITPVPMDGVELEGSVEVTVRKRHPALELVGGPPTFRVAEGTLRADEPFALHLDPDGGDGDYLLSLLKTQPTLRSRAGVIGWQAVPRGQGVWHIVPTGEWTGDQPGIFRDQETTVQLEIAWAAGRTPGEVTVPVSIPPRWGKRGFVILVLAILALMLALLVVGWMRTPPAKGVLLYTVDGLDGTVGRLELAPIGRKTRQVLTDENGKLTFGTKGDAIAKVRPTRVGAMLEYNDPSGGKERRLLVDGVSLRIGRHLVRYIYGRAEQDATPPAPAPGEDLLGPEYDIASGRIEALEDPDERTDA